MPSAIPIAGDVAGAATALAGLILVFLGATAASFESYQKQEQRSVIGRYQRRAWLAFVGFCLALLAVPLALVGKWYGQECAALVAAALLSVALIWVLLAALFAVMEVR